MIEFEQTEQVIRIRLNKPKANAYDLAFHQSFRDSIVRANQTQGANVVILDSKLEKFFCAGADIKAFQENTVEDNQRMVEQARENLWLIENSQKVFIASIAGHCLGGGLELVLACDLRFAADKHFLIGLPEIKLGLIPGNGGSQRLTKLVGISHALEILLTGDPISPQRAVEIGLFNRMLPESELDSFVSDFAEKLSKGPGLAMAATKRAVYTGATLPLEDALKWEDSLVNSLYETEDAKEGFLAFVEQRDPEFKGK